jgi:hypothetical protein
VQFQLHGRLSQSDCLIPGVQGQPGQYNKTLYEKQESRPGAVDHVYNPSYLEGGDHKVHDSMPGQVISTNKPGVVVPIYNSSYMRYR